MRALCLTEAEEEVALFFHMKYIFPQDLWIPPGLDGRAGRKIRLPKYTRKDTVCGQSHAHHVRT